MLSSEGSGISVWSTTDLWDAVWSSTLMAGTPASKIPGPACARHRELFDLLSGRDRATPDRSESGVSARRQSGVPRLGAARSDGDLGPGSPSTKRSAVFTPRRDALFATMGAADKITPQARVQIGGNQLIGLCSLRTAARLARLQRVGEPFTRKSRASVTSAAPKKQQGPKNTLPKFARSSAPPRSAFSLARKRQ